MSKRPLVRDVENAVPQQVHYTINDDENRVRKTKDDKYTFECKKLS